jgi:hypothetical protein
MIGNTTSYQNGSLEYLILNHLPAPMGEYLILNHSITPRGGVNVLTYVFWTCANGVSCWRASQSGQYKAE